MYYTTFKDTLFERSKGQFNEVALELFRYQVVHCEPYRRFVEGLKINPAEIQHWTDIPHLPIEAFKNHEVKTGNFEAEVVYTSSGTTGSNTSKHFVAHKSWYERVFTEAFKESYGSPDNYQWLCLLPSYLERKGSSLIDMAAQFIEQSKVGSSGFYLDNMNALMDQVQKTADLPTVILGVSFALLDLAESHSQALGPNVIMMETGGMKGRRKEMIRAELHEVLTTSFHLPGIHSEYGMTELMSQAYSKGGGIYTSPSWMRVSLRDPADPLSTVRLGKTGGINIIDLANVDSCAFLATQDLGRLHSETTFEVLGRFDNSDIRGCNLMVV
ncbi:MAG: acyl transferase [Flavobacteriia bacterium]|nr:acyl transferase [Flavobacteriia bacterium]